MKLFILLSLFFSLNLSAQNQLSYFLEYNGSLKEKLTDINQPRDLVIDNTISIGAKKNKMLYSLGFGREDWYMEFFENYTFNPEYFAFHCRTYKFTVLIERQFLIPKTKLSVRLGAGGKIYFLNQMKDSYILIYPNDLLVGSKPSVLSNIKNSQNSINGLTLDQYSFITKVPLAVMGNLALQYNFKKLGVKLYFEPYFMLINYKNAQNFSEKSSFVFYSNLGLGINYPLNFKKKEDTSPN